jgi:ubiquinone biosynthesis protein UbiJ
VKAPVPALAALESAFNQYLALDPSGSARLAELQGRVIALELRGFDLGLFVLPGAGGVRLVGSYEGEPDAALIGTPLAFLRLGARGGAAETLFSGDVEIRGDTELGQHFKTILDGIDIDWEEHLSRLTGDVIAHQLGRGARALRAWTTRSLDSLALDAAEYLEEEGRWLARGAEVQRFVDEVDRLRSDVDRAEARIRRLRRPS